ncbi:hypothetical protein HaLaN_12823 [Haematococcus lacustris]|uniref:Uncharacterized protein n=1 Tax=Haematococcus lacustris TaxID=44745 RepID=A0A699ZAX7_HAELA|nr:hypothetical protein HaLaN_12823 [Haematococcus lacustris]
MQALLTSAGQWHCSEQSARNPPYCSQLANCRGKPGTAAVVNCAIVPWGIPTVCQGKRIRNGLEFEDGSARAGSRMLLAQCKALKECDSTINRGLRSTGDGSGAEPQRVGSGAEPQEVGSGAEPPASSTYF